MWDARAYGKFEIFYFKNFTFDQQFEMQAY